MIAVRVKDGDCLFAVRARPGASRRRAGGERNGALVVETTAPPEKGRANGDIVKILARALCVPKSRVSIVSGGKGRDKTVRVAGIDADELERRLALLAGAG